MSDYRVEKMLSVLDELYYDPIYKQISLTAVRAIIILFALIDGPKDYFEIAEFYKKITGDNQPFCSSTLDADIRTLKEFGCDISKATKRNNLKHHILSHPFFFNLSLEDINAIKTVYTRCLNYFTPHELYGYHMLFSKLALMVDVQEVKDAILGISILKNVKMPVFEKLLAYVHANRKLRIEYVKGSNTKRVQYDISIKKFCVRSQKLYLFCYNHTLDKRSFLNVERIESIIYKMFNEKGQFDFDTRLKFKLYNPQKYFLNPNEIVVDKSDDYCVVRGSYYNEFIAIQRMLELGKDCSVIEPIDIKNKIISELSDMKNNYEGI